MTDTDNIVAIATAKLTDILTQHEAIKSAREILDKREAEINEDWKAWYHIYQKEKPPDPPAEENSSAIPEAALMEGMTARLNLAPEEPFSEIERIASIKNYGAKTTAVKQVLSDFGEHGVTPKELSDELAKRGIKTSESFAGNTLFRLKKKGEVFMVSEGRYALSRFSAPDYEYQETSIEP